VALTQEDLAALGAFIDQKIAAATAAKPQTPEDRASVVGVAEVPFDAGPLFYLHLANGDVIQSHDSASTHIAAADGSTQQIIGRFQVPADVPEAGELSAGGSDNQ
jgi:hypothetical protein